MLRVGRIRPGPGDPSVGGAVAARDQGTPDTGPRPTISFGVLGPLSLLAGDGTDITPTGSVQRLLLATLLTRANRPVAVDTLLEVLWPDDTSGRGRDKLHLTVHRVRALLASPDRIALTAAGYQIRVEDGELDLARFDALASRLLVDDPPPAEAATLAQEALSLWRGETAFEGVEHIATAPEAERCAARRRWFHEVWCAAELARGRHGAVLPELEALAAAHPLHEQFQVLLMRALQADGRRGEALAVYRSTRVALRDELGVDPGVELEQQMAQVHAGTGPAAVDDRGRSPAELPPAPTGLTDREGELDAIDATLSGQARTCVVTGMPGVGKTALVLAWSHARRDDYPDGQLFVDLRGFGDGPPTSPAEALATCLKSLGLPPSRLPEGLEDRASLFRSVVSERRVLVVLDNAVSAEQVRPLLPAGSHCTVLVTSREMLQGLGARDGAGSVRLAPLSETGSTMLLRELIGPRAAADEASVAALARLCGHLPLALRIAAQQVELRSHQGLPELVAEMVDDQHRLDLLDVGDGETDIRAVLAWSCQELPDETARVFRALGLMPGRDADEETLAAWRGQEPRAQSRHLDALVRAHLLERDETGRLRQHELVRAYSAEQGRLACEPGEVEAAHARVLDFYARKAAAVGDPLELDTAWSWFEQEWGNVLLALDTADASAADSVLALARAFGAFLRVSGQHEAGLRLHARQLELARETGDLRAEHAARLSLGNLRMRLGDQVGAESDYRAALALTDRVGDPLLRAASLTNLGGLLTDTGDLEQAGAALSEAVEIFGHHDDARGVSVGLSRLGDCKLLVHDPGGAADHFEEALRICDESGVEIVRSEACVGLAHAAIAQGDLARAERWAQQAIELMERHPGSEDEPLALGVLAAVRLAQDRRPEAEDLVGRALERAHRLGAIDVTMWVLRGYLVAAPLGVEALRQEAIEFARKHGFRGIAAELDSAEAIPVPG
nr:BTAD domain-containing putative transcriptional regulator [Ornithinimicrobium sp. HY1745]